MGGYSFVARLSHLTIEHASLSRRSTVPTPTRHLQHLDAPYVFSIRYIESFWSSYPLTVSPSVAIGHHLPPRIAIAFSLLSRVPNFSMSHSSISVIFPPNTSRSSLCISHSPPRLCEFYSLLLCLKGTSVNLLPPPLDYRLAYPFFLAGPGPQHEIAVSAFSRSPLGRVDTFSFLYLSFNPLYISTSKY